MKLTAPQIGFDRFIRIDWVTLALKVRAGIASPDELAELLESSGLSVEARKKTRTILNRLWLKPRPELDDFAKRGACLFKAHPDVPIAALSWGMAIATYPFFGKVAETVGRLTALQGDCTSVEVHRRMSELYGEREGTYRMTNMVLQTQASWGAIERSDDGKRLTRLRAIAVENDEAIAWLVEAAVRYMGKVLSISSVKTLAVLYPLSFDQALAYVLSSSSNLELRQEGADRQSVALKSFL